MKKLAAKVRVAEAIESKLGLEYDNVFRIGSANKWFLHHSENLLICGSKKANEFEPTKLSMNTLTKIVLSEINWNEKLPDKYCPKNICLFSACEFYELNAPSCKQHIKNVDTFDKGGNALGHKLIQALRESDQAD